MYALLFLSCQNPSHRIFTFYPHLYLHPTTPIEPTLSRNPPTAAQPPPSLIDCAPTSSDVLNNPQNNPGAHRPALDPDPSQLLSSDWSPLLFETCPSFRHEGISTLAMVATTRRCLSWISTLIFGWGSSGRSTFARSSRCGRLANLPTT